MLELGRYQGRAHVTFIMTGTLDPEAYRGRFAARTAKARSRSADRYLEHFDEILAIQRYLIAEAERHGLPIVDNVQFDTAVVAVIRAVIATLEKTLPQRDLEGASASRRTVALEPAAPRRSAPAAPSPSRTRSSSARRSRRSCASRLTFVRDPVTVNYVREFGASLVKGARPSPFEFRFFVIEDERAQRLRDSRRRRCT